MSLKTKMKQKILNVKNKAEAFGVDFSDDDDEIEHEDKGGDFECDFECGIDVFCPRCEAMFLAKVKWFYRNAIPNVRDIVRMNDLKKRRRAQKAVFLGIENMNYVYQRIEKFSDVFEGFEDLVSKYYDVCAKIGIPDWISYFDTTKYDFSSEDRDKLMDESKSFDVRFFKEVKNLENTKKAREFSPLTEIVVHTVVV